MYDKITEDISTEYYQNQFPNDGQRFVAWYLRNIHNLDTFEAKDCITDGAGDKQIDAIYIDNQASTVYIIQGKFYSGDTVDAEPLREVLSSWIQIKDLAHLQEGANHKLQIKINEMATALEDDYEICFELITTSELTESARMDLQAFQKELAESENLQANIVVVDNETLKFKYDEALNKNRPYINHEFPLESGKFMEMKLDGTKVAIVALPLKECIKIPGIKDGSLFRKNVRQSLGSTNKVNKGIARTIRNNAGDFFFLHNGITAICSQMSIHDNTLSAKELNVVNGCQSLSTIFSCSESAKKATDAYIMFRFYEISDPERADNISTSTNSQSAVKARDLRSNDKAVLAMKKAYEQYYTDGYFITKRGEIADPVKYNTAHIVNLTDLGKQLIAWNSQRPTISYSETKIFDKYFDQLFHLENLDAVTGSVKNVKISLNETNNGTGVHVVGAGAAAVASNSNGIADPKDLDDISATPKQISVSTTITALEQDGKKMDEINSYMEKNSLTPVGKQFEIAVEKDNSQITGEDAYKVKNLPYEAAVTIPLSDVEVPSGYHLVAIREHKENSKNPIEEIDFETGEDNIGVAYTDEFSTFALAIKKDDVKPTPASSKSSTPIKKDNVVTCQMAGYPANYAWNEAAKACQPGYLDASGAFRSTAGVKKVGVPNTYDKGLKGNVISLAVSTVFAFFAAFMLKKYR